MFRRFSVQDDDAQEVEILLNLNHIVEISAARGIVLIDGTVYQSFIGIHHVIYELDAAKSHFTNHTR